MHLCQVGERHGELSAGRKKKTGEPELNNDLTGMIAIQPKSRSWAFMSQEYAKPINVQRLQIPLLPRRQSTLHGVQGSTTEPGLVAYWRFPKKLSEESRWLAHYVILSRPRRLANLLSHGLPDRNVIEGGPPATINESFHRIFAEKIRTTNLACQQARNLLDWPPRNAPEHATD